MPGMLAGALAFAQANPFWGAVMAGLLVGGAHFLAHTLAGDSDAFEEAGVMQAGFTVMVIAGIVVFLLLTAGGGA